MERRDSLQDQERHKVARNATATYNDKDTAKERATEDHTTSDSLQPTNEVERENNTTNYTIQQHHTPPKVQLDKEFHILQKYTLEETSGTEKAHTGREYMLSLLSLEQRFT